MLGTWFSKFFRKPADADTYIAKIQIANSRQKDRRVSTKANIQPSSDENWISKQFIEEYDLLGGLGISDEQIENRIESFTWYYRINKDGHAYDCEFTSNFRITSQRGCNVLFGANPTEGDINGEKNPFENASLKKRTSWKPRPPSTDGLSRRSQFSSVNPRSLGDVSDPQATTRQDVEITGTTPIPKDVVLQQSARQNVSSVPPSQTSAAPDSIFVSHSTDLHQATGTAYTEGKGAEHAMASCDSESFYQTIKSSQDQSCTTITSAPGTEGDQAPTCMTNEVTPATSAAATEIMDGNRPSVTMTRYLDSPLRLADLEDGDRIGRQGQERIQPIKQRKRRKKERTSHAGEQSSKPQQLLDYQDSQYWQYDEKTGGYYHKDPVSEEIIWYPVLD